MTPLELLKSDEWVKYRSGDPKYCKWCGKYEPDGHASYCPLVSAISQLEKDKAITAASQAELAEKDRQIGELVEALKVIQSSTACQYSHTVATKALNDFAKCGGKITEVPYSVEVEDE